MIGSISIGWAIVSVPLWMAALILFVFAILAVISALMTTKVTNQEAIGAFKGAMVFLILAFVLAYCAAKTMGL